jgi:hypothetical protein
MAQEILIIGESGTGKTTSFRTLDPKETFILNVARKPLPFKGWKTNYTTISKENAQGNYFSSDNADALVRTMKHINDNMPHIKVVIVDDFQYLMANEYMRRANERGFDKFTDIGKHAWEVAHAGKNLRDDITFIMVGHAEETTDFKGTRKLKFKTIGKLVDNVITMEGLFTVVLFTDIHMNGEKEVQYRFQTNQSDGGNTCKSPMGMFSETFIPNDMSSVIDTINNYYK